MSTNELHAYQVLYEATVHPRLYSAPWWMDATCGPGQWRVLVESGPDQKPVAALPYFQTRIRGLSAVITPPFTQWVTLIGQSQATSFYTTLLRKLPASSILDLSVWPDEQGLHQDLPFPVHLKYSYIIPAGVTRDAYRSRYNEGLKRNLKEAEQVYSIHGSDDMALFLELCRSSYLQRKLKPPAWLDTIIPGVFKAIQYHSCGEMSLAFENGKAIAGVLTARDQHSAYYLAGGRTTDEHGASAHALLLDQAIQSASAAGLTFDFEGSMHPGIANFFQAFGARPHPYWQIRKFRGMGKVWQLFH